MTVEDIKNFLENEPLIKELKLNCQRPTRQYSNKNILNKIILNNKVGIKTNNELIYLLRNKDNLENLHIFCECGKKNSYQSNIKQYTYHCCRLCGSKYSREKAHNTCTERYNNPYYNNPTKRKFTNLKRYNHPYYTNRMKARITCNKLYGNEFYNNRLKMKETNLKKRGVEYYSQSEESRNRYKNKEWVAKVYNKVNNTKRKNKTFNSSKIEDLLFLNLKSKFSDTIHHYTDSRYPFECDFYIPSQDLFIELNFHWTHGKEPFDKNNKNHLEILNKWKSKNTKFYNKAIEVWSNKDLLKLKTFQDNKLNYKIFYTEKEFNEWLLQAI